MTNAIGLDLGTSALKAVLVDEAETVLAHAEIPLVTQHPEPLASEQRPGEWTLAAEAALAQLAAAAPAAMQGVSALGIAGQMHAALLLDAADRPLRPAMLWNDGRAFAEADALKRLGDDLAAELGVRAMAGLTGPKLAWLARHEPAMLANAKTLLLPKDFVRLHLSGERSTDVSDAAGTWLLDQARRTWSAAGVEAVGIDPALLPGILESTEPAGTLRPALARRFGLRDGVVVAAGGGDTPVGGVGMGAVEDGDAFVSLGTSAQVFVAGATYQPSAANMVHGFCHALPGRWYRMAALLNGASVLALAARLSGHDGDKAALLARVEGGFRGPGALLMLPYLAGERTPHDDPHARGVIFGLSSDSSPEDVAQAAMEGVAFSLADALDALAASGARPTEATLIGGGARSRLWARIVASVLGLPLHRRAASIHGAASGAARLARAAATGALSCAASPVIDTVEPDAALATAYAPRLLAWRRLYQALRPEFQT